MATFCKISNEFWLKYGAKWMERMITTAGWMVAITANSDSLPHMITDALIGILGAAIFNCIMVIYEELIKLENADTSFKTIVEKALVFSFMGYVMVYFVALILVIFIFDSVEVRMIVLWGGTTILICALGFILASIKKANCLKATGTAFLAVAVPLLYAYGMGKVRGLLTKEGCLKVRGYFFPFLLRFSNQSLSLNKGFLSFPTRSSSQME